MIGDLLQDIANIANQVGASAEQIAKVQRGESKVAIVPADSISISIPVQGKPYSVTLPVVPVVIGVGLLVYFAFRRR
jgi:hypothetical protein